MRSLRMPCGAISEPVATRKMVIAREGFIAHPRELAIAILLSNHLAEHAIADIDEVRVHQDVPTEREEDRRPEGGGIIAVGGGQLPPSPAERTPNANPRTPTLPRQ